MAREFGLLFVLWLVAACLATGITTTTNSGTPMPENTTTTNLTTTTTGNAITVTSLPTATPDPCESNQCGVGSTCEPRFNGTVVCLCLPGEYYSYDSCVRAKVFPGQLLLTNLTYSEDMKDKTSEDFLKTSQDIISALNEVFRNSSHRSDYYGSTVLELQKGANSNRQSRSENSDPVDATVEIMFRASSDITATEVQEIMKNASCCENSLLNGTSFTNESLCDRSACDEKTTICSSEDGSYSCTCAENYVMLPYAHRACIACPSGQKAENSECVDCPFGYSGFNCNESWQLALVIVGSVLGGLLLITIILLPVVAHKSSKKRSKKNKDTGELHFSLSPAKGPLVNSSISQANSIHGSANAAAVAGVPGIPRATATNSWDRTSPESSAYSRQNPGPVGRNSNNPYDQKLPQINPYASRQGQSNPYYEHDNGRRFNY